METFNRRISINMNKYKVLGVAGVARSGKDSAFRILSKHLGVRRIAFADALKEAVKPLCEEYLSISPFTEEPNEKNIIRPILVSVGNAARAINHRVWIDKIVPEVHKAQAEGILPVITDVRFSEETNDECGFVQHELGGFLVHIDRILAQGEDEVILQSPANESEAKNYPTIKARANVCVMASNLEELEQEIIEKVIPHFK